MIDDYRKGAIILIVINDNKYILLEGFNRYILFKYLFIKYFF